MLVSKNARKLTRDRCFFCGLPTSNVYFSFLVEFFRQKSFSKSTYLRRTTLVQLELSALLPRTFSSERGMGYPPTQHLQWGHVSKVDNIKLAQRLCDPGDRVLHEELSNSGGRGLLKFWTSSDANVNSRRTREKFTWQLGWTWSRATNVWCRLWSGLVTGLGDDTQLLWGQQRFVGFQSMGIRWGESLKSPRFAAILFWWMVALMRRWRR